MRTRNMSPRKVFNVDNIAPRPHIVAVGVSPNMHSLREGERTALASSQSYYLRKLDTDDAIRTRLASAEALATAREFIPADNTIARDHLMDEIGCHIDRAMDNIATQQIARSSMLDQLDKAVEISTTSRIVKVSKCGGLASFTFARTSLKNDLRQAFIFRLTRNP